MKRFMIILSLFLFVISLEVGFAQAEDEWRYPHLISEKIARFCGKSTNPPVLKEVELKCSGEIDTETGIFTYQYTLKNGQQSTGCLKRLKVDIIKPAGTVELSEYGLKDYPENVDKNTRRYPDEPEMVPVAFPDLPRKILPKIGEVTIWDGGTAGYGMTFWSASLEQYIPPGDKISGFVMTTHGLPTIRDFMAEPRYIAKNQDIYNMGVSEEEFIAKTGELFAAFYDSIAFKGKTIGPTAPPAELVPLDFLENIISMKHEAVSLGWITNKGIEMGLDQKLEAVKNKLRQGNNGAARNVLKAFIHEVEAQGCESYGDCPKGKHLKPEAYAILKYNAQYLVDNLN